jgi:hypothetical protein
VRERVFGVLRVGWKEFVSHDLWLYYRRFEGGSGGRGRGVLGWLGRGGAEARIGDLAGTARGFERCPLATNRAKG